MPVVKSRVVLGIARGLHAFLNLDIGLTRGEVPDPERQLSRVQEQLGKKSRQLEQTQKRLRANGQKPRPSPQQPAEGRRGSPGTSGQPDKEAREDQPRHRRAVGGRWDEIGELQFDLLRNRGLQPQHHFLDVGCGSLRGGVRFIPYLEPGHYYGVDRSQELLDAGQVELEAAGLQDRGETLVRMDDFGFERLGQTFDYALAQSVFTHLPLNSITRCLVNMDRVLRHGGVFFATFFENHKGKQHLEPLAQGDGVVSHYDRDPFHYTPDAFVWACEGTALEAEYIGDWEHPRNQYMLAFRKTE